QQKSTTHARFACYVRGMGLQHPFVVQPELGWIEKWPKMSDVDYAALRARNKAALQDDPMPEKLKAPQTLGEAHSLPATKPQGCQPIISKPPTIKKDPSAATKWKRPQK